MEPKIVKIQRAEFAFITDLHLSAHPPGRRVDDYETAIINKLATVREWTQNRNSICLCGGDVLHIKSPFSKANSNRMLNRVIDLFKGFNTGKVYGIVGNHDIQFDRHDTFDHQPLGILAHAGAYEVLEGSTIFEDPNGLRVEVVPFHYEDDMVLLQRILNTPKRANGVDYRIGMAHAMARPGGAQSHFGNPIIGYDLLEDIDFDVFLWGHDHSHVEDTEVGKCLHIHPGSLARAALASDEVDRDIYAVGLRFVDSESWGILKKPLPTAPLEVAFRVADKDIVKASETTEVKGFVKELGARLGSIATIDAIEVIEELCGTDIPLKDTVTELCEF
jgi:predicted phosphodiesterase